MKITGIIGVIIITFIVILIASITYSHVESIREQQNEKNNLYIDGYVSNIESNRTIYINKSPLTIWKVTLSEHSREMNTTEYLMIFKETYPPHSDLYLRFYYSKIQQNEIEYLLITAIEPVNMI
jgi:hypothetical protein